MKKRLLLSACLFHFELSLSPDFDALVKLRKPKKQNIERVQIENSDKIAQSISTVKAEKTERVASKELLLKPTTITLKALNNKTNIIQNRVLL